MRLINSNRFKVISKYYLKLLSQTDQSMRGNRNKLKPDFQTAEEPMRPPYRQSLHIISPQHTGIPPRHTAEHTLQPSFKPSPVSYCHTSTSYQEGMINAGMLQQNSQNEGGESNRQSALANFVDECRSSTAKQPAQNHQHVGMKSRNAVEQQRSRLRDNDGSSSYLDVGSVVTAEHNGSTSCILKTRSSSAMIIGAVDSSAGPRYLNTNSSLDETSEHRKSSQGRLQRAYLEAQEKKRAVRGAKEAREAKKQQRSLKECKNELQQDRKAKAHRKKKEHKHKSRTRKKPEVVVVYRYPPPSTTNQTSSYDYTISSSVETLEKGSHLQHQQRENAGQQPSSRNFTPQIGEKRGKHAAEKYQIVSVTSGAFCNESSMPISPSDHSVPSQTRHRQHHENLNRHHYVQEEVEKATKAARAAQVLIENSKSRDRSVRHSSKGRSKERQKKNKNKKKHDGGTNEYSDSRMIALYQQSSSQERTSSHRQLQAPLTSSQLADSYIERPGQESYLYYQNQQKKLSRKPIVADLMEYEPQKVVLVNGGGATNSPMKGQRSISCQQIGLWSQNQVKSTTSSKLNLSNYRNIISKKEQAFTKKMNEMRDLNQKVASQQSLVDQSIQQQSIQSRDSNKLPEQLIMRQLSSPNISSFIAVQMEQQRPRSQISQVAQSYISYLERTKQPNMALEETQPPRSRDLTPPSPPAKPAPKPIVSAKQYAISKMTGQLDTKREFIRVSGVKRAQEEGSKSQSRQEQKLTSADSVNAKTTEPQAALKKDDSKSSFIRRFERHHTREVSRSNIAAINEKCGNSPQQQHQQKLGHSEYGAAQEQQSNPQSQDETGKYNRSQSHLDLHDETRYSQSRAELFNEQRDTFASTRQRSSEHIGQQEQAHSGISSHRQPPQDYYHISQQHHQLLLAGTAQYEHSRQQQLHQRSSDQIGTYYTLGAAEQHFNSQKTRRNEGSSGSLVHQYRQNPHHQQESMYQDSETVVETTRIDAPKIQPVINTPEVQDLISRADRMISASIERLEVDRPELQQPTSSHRTFDECFDKNEEPNVRSSEPNEEITYVNHHQHSSDRERIMALQRQTEELQRAPDFYNQRVATLKHQTMHLHQFARNYTSGDKYENQQTELKSHQWGAHDDADVTNRVSEENTVEAESQSGVNRLRRRLPSPQEEDSGLVKQQDVTSSFLREEQHQQQHLAQQQEYSSQTQGRKNSELNIDQSNKTQRNENHHGAGHQSFRPPAQASLEKEDNRLPRLGYQQRDRSQVYSQQITMQNNGNSQVNELDLTKKLDKQVLSMGDTYRMSYKQCGTTGEDITSQGDGGTYTDATGTVVVEEGTHQQPIETTKSRRRQQKRDRKIQQLQELHDKAQQSMTKIASELTSNGSFIQRSFTNIHGLPLQHSAHNSSHTMSQAANQPTHSQNTLVEARATVRSKVEKLANTRKEIKRLIKIQNKHGKILKQLKKAGVVEATASSIPQDSNFTSLSEMSEHQKQKQVLASTHLLQQMQEMFQQLAEVQGKLDFEIAERQRRTGQMRDDQMQYIETYTTLNVDGEQQEQQQHSQPHDSNRASNHCQSGSYNQKSQEQEEQPMPQHEQQQMHYKDRNHELSHGTTSTLFWETQMAAQGQESCGGNLPSPYMPLMLNNSHVKQSSLEHGDKFGSNYLPPQFHQLNQSTEQQSMTTDRSDHNQMLHENEIPDKDNGLYINLMQQPDNLHNPMMMVVQRQSISAPDGTQVTDIDECEALMQQNAYTMNTETASEQLNMMQKTNNMPTSAMSRLTDGNSSTALNGIRVEQLCEILSREIGRVREESLEQAQQMRQQYELELKALRNEFFVKQSAKCSAHHANVESRVTIGNNTGVLSSEDAPETTQTMEQMMQMRQQSDVQHASRIGSDNCTPRTHTVSDRILSLRKSQQSNVNHERIKSQDDLTRISAMEVQLSAGGGPRIKNYATTTQMVQQSVFDELQKVKAERDLYYDKLMKVRERIENGKNQRSNNTQSSIASFTVKKNISLSGNNESVFKQVAATISNQHNTFENAQAADQIHSDFFKADSVNQLQRNIQSVDEIVIQEPQAMMWPSIDVISNTKACQFQHDFADIHSRNHVANTLNTVVTQDSNQPATSMSSSNLNMLKPPSFQHEPSKTNLYMMAKKQNESIGVAIQKQQAGKIVHRFRSYQEQQQNSIAMAKSRQGDPVRRSNQYMNVRHNRASIQRQQNSSKLQLKDSMRCSSCLMQSVEMPASIDRSCVSGRSDTSGTRTNVQAHHAVVLQRQPSRDWCKSCSIRIETQLPSPFNQAPMIQSTSSAGQLQAATLLQLQKQQQQHGTVSFNRIAQGSESKQNAVERKSENCSSSERLQILPPSANIGGGKQMRSMVARSPDLIARMAIEQEIYMSKLQHGEQIVTEEETQRTEREYTADGSMAEDVRHFTLDQDRANNALSVISNYLEKYDRQNTNNASRF